MKINDTFQIEQLDDTIVLTPLIDLGQLEYERFERDGKTVMEQLAGARVKNVVVDLKNTDYYGSAALGFFVRLWKRSRMQGSHIAFCNLSRHEREILARTQLDTLWPICGTKDEAMDAVRDGDEHQ